MKITARRKVWEGAKGQVPHQFMLVIIVLIQLLLKGLSIPKETRTEVQVEGNIFWRNWERYAFIHKIFIEHPLCAQR